MIGDHPFTPQTPFKNSPNFPHQTMTTIPQPSSLSPLNTITTLSPSKPTLFTSTLTKPSPFKTLKLSFSLNPSNAQPSLPTSSNSPEISPQPEPDNNTDPVKLAFARAKAYKKSIEPNPTKNFAEKEPVQEPENGGSGSGSDGAAEGTKEVPVPVKIALEKAKEYKKNKGIVGGSSEETSSGLKGGNVGNSGSGYVEKKVSKKEEKKEEPTISSINFVGLNFADKKKGRGLPAGLIPVADSFPEGDLPEVEFIVGDASNFVDATTLNPKPTQEDNSDFYKPKVSTWGVFPRPGNISKTFGGGRVIRPGEVLETAEDKAAKDARTRQLLAAYKKKIGLNIDAKLKYECEKAFKDGDSLMDLGKLKEALPYYEKIMNKLAFQSELHGLAALQWSICQDSLSSGFHSLEKAALSLRFTPEGSYAQTLRPNEARVMYERLQSHPNVQVSKKARQFMFGFQAMEMMKVSGSSLPPKNTDYQNYFEAFIEDKANYSPEEDEVEGALNQALPYILFLVSPILIVLFLAVQK